jgi:iron complex transport system substrate-binding protein
MKAKAIFSFFLLAIFHVFLVTVIYAEVPHRIISLAPNITEILFAMGLGDNIVGVTSFCDYPEKAKKKPKVGGMSNPSLEAILSLNPDIVVMTTDGNPKEFEERLRSLKIKTFVFKARRLHELPDGIRDLGAALGARANADALAKEIETAINRFIVEKQAININNPLPVTPRSSLKKKVLFIVWPEPLIVAGRGTAIDDAITLLGATNIASKTKVPYPKYSIEEIIHQAPDAIFIGKGHILMEDVSRNLLKKIAMVPAVKNGTVFYVGDNLYRLGPMIIMGIEEMAECLK